MAKDKAHLLPYYLKTIENQTYPASAIHLYIRTNNNNDDTAKILLGWLNRVGHRYARTVIDVTDVPENVQQYRQHEWNETRFKVLADIRQKSIEYAIANQTHYFVVD